MRALLVGSTGRVGQAFLELALGGGHGVTAIARDTSRVKLNHPHLTVVQADVLDRESLRNVFGAEPFDAAVNVAGADPLKPSALVTQAASNLIPLLEEFGVKRYLGITGTAQMPKTRIGELSSFMLRRTPVRHAIRDHTGALSVVKSSSLDWFLVGCPWIKDGPATGRFQRSKVFPGGMRSIHPGDVASRLYEEFERPTLHRQIEGIWY